MTVRTAAFFAATSLAALAAAAEDRLVVHHAGRLLDVTDTPITASIELTFKLFAEDRGGTALWSDAFTVQPHQGLYSVELGASEHVELTADVLSQARFLSVSVGPLELLPRQRIGAAPLALRAVQANDAARLGGLDASRYVARGADGKIGELTSSGTITATTFKGALEGTATTAATATNALSLGGFPAADYLRTGAGGELGELSARKFIGPLNGRADTAGNAETLGGLSAGSFLQSISVGNGLTGAGTAASPLALSLSFGAGLKGAGTASDPLRLDPDAVTKPFAFSLLQDGDFESQKFGWWVKVHESEAPIFDTITRASGAASVKFRSTVTTAGSTIRYLDPIPVTPGETVRIRAKVRGQNITQGTQGWHKLYMVNRWMKLDGSLASGDGYSGGCPDADFGSGTFDWKSVTATHTVPPDAAWLKVYYLGLIDSATGEGWIDELRVETTAASSNPVRKLATVNRYDSDGAGSPGTFLAWEAAGSPNNVTTHWPKIPGSPDVPFVKRSEQSYLRVTWSDTFRCRPCTPGSGKAGDDSCSGKNENALCWFGIWIDDKFAQAVGTDPSSRCVAAIHNYAANLGSTALYTDMHRPATITCLVRNVGAGPHVATRRFTTHNDAAKDSVAYVGWWNQNQFLEIEEVFE